MSHSRCPDDLLLPGLPGRGAIQTQGGVFTEERQTWRPAAEEREKPMSLYKRGDVWWYKLRFAGQMIRESTKSNSRTVARAAEHARRRELEQGFNRIERQRTVTDRYIKMQKDTKFRAEIAEKIGLGFELPKAKPEVIVPSVPNSQETEVAVRHPKKREKLAPRARFELATLRLTAECSTIELPGSSRATTILS